jgi:potassium efflux system protein
VSNFVSGLILLYERPIQVGVTIEFESILGEVKRIGIRLSTIMTFQGAELIIPNAMRTSERIINWTLN